MLCAIWYHLYNFKKMKNTHGGVLLLVKLQAKVTLLRGCSFFYFLSYFKIGVIFANCLLTYLGNVNSSVTDIFLTSAFARNIGDGHECIEVDVEDFS